MILGDFILGFLSDKYGKRIILFLTLIFISLASFYLLSPEYVDSLLTSNRFLFTPILFVLGFILMPIHNSLIILTTELFNNISNIRMLYGFLNFLILVQLWLICMLSFY